MNDLDTLEPRVRQGLGMPDVTYGARDVLQVEFSGFRMVNHISFLLSRFPNTVRAEYWNPETNDWAPLKQQTGQIAPVDPAYSITAQRALWEGWASAGRLTWGFT